MSQDQAILDLSNRQIKRTLKAAIDAAQGLYWYEMRRCRDQRTLKQNARFHGALPVIAAALTECWGYAVDTDAAKAFLKDKFLRTEIVNKDTGETKGFITRDTHTLDEGEFRTFMEAVHHFGLHELEIPPEQLDILREPADWAHAS